MEENKMENKPEVTAGFDAKDVEENKGMAVLSYIGILVLIPLLAKKESKYAQFHAKQGLVLFIGEVVLWIVNIIPILGQLIWLVGMIFFLVVSIMGIVNALNGRAKELPLVGSLSHKIMK